jgi:archaeosine-15-forming tRNA-guanine transglycosylase
METTGIVHKVFEEDGELCVVLPQHDGIFSLSLKEVALCARLRDAHAQGRAVRLSFDKDLKIQKVLWADGKA